MEDSVIRSDELQEVRHRLEGVFGVRIAGDGLPLTGAWSLAAGEGNGRSGDLVLDPRNKRLKLYDLSAVECRDPAIAGWREGLETCSDIYSKLIVYGRSGQWEDWIKAGFLFEGIIEGFFADDQDAHIWAAFGDNERSDAPRDGRHDEIVQIAAAKPLISPEPAEGFTCIPAGPGHAEPISELMDDTFSEYPTPITAGLVSEQLATGSHVFRCMVDGNGDVVASASAEIDHQRGCAEMTDCATRPDQRGSGHMGYLLHSLARDVGRRLGITRLYTLARADEVGMNCVFGKLGYEYTGRLINNCRMPNGWESMNIWCKTTSESGPDTTSMA